MSASPASSGVSVWSVLARAISLWATSAWMRQWRCLFAREVVAIRTGPRKPQCQSLAGRAARQAAMPLRLWRPVIWPKAKLGTAPRKGHCRPAGHRGVVARSVRTQSKVESSSSERTASCHDTSAEPATSRTRGEIAKVHATARLSGHGLDFDKSFESAPPKSVCNLLITSMLCAGKSRSTQRRGYHASIAGCGLGLKLARDMVKEIGGRLTIETEEGRGSGFTIHPPVTA